MILNCRLCRRSWQTFVLQIVCNSAVLGVCTTPKPLIWQRCVCDFEKTNGEFKDWESNDCRQWDGDEQVRRPAVCTPLLVWMSWAELLSSEDNYYYYKLMWDIVIVMLILWQRVWSSKCVENLQLWNYASIQNLPASRTYPVKWGFELCRIFLSNQVTLKILIYIHILLVITCSHLLLTFI